MKKLLYLLPLLCINLWAVEATPTVLEQFQGGVDILSPDKLSLQNGVFSLMQNVRTDEFGQLTKRLGSQRFNPLPLPGLQPIKNVFTFTQNTGNSYIITCSSTSVWASNSGVMTQIIGNRTQHGYRDRFAMLGNKLYGMNGIDLPWSWDGINTVTYTVSNSTSFPTGKYPCYWLQRLWVAGDPSYPSRLYYSWPGQPAYFQGFIDIATDDGDQITGMMLYQGNMLVTKSGETYMMYQYAAGGFTYIQISPNIGCLYMDTMCIYNQLATWMSSRGMEQMNGSTFNPTPLSAPIDNYFKSLPQTINNSQLPITLQTASDWGAGTGVNIDTTTTPGTVTMPQTLLNGSTFSYLVNTAQGWGAGTLINIDSITIPGNIIMSFENPLNTNLNTAAQWNNGTYSNTAVSGNSVQLASQGYSLITSYTNNYSYGSTSGGLINEDNSGSTWSSVWDMGATITGLQNFSVTSITGLSGASSICIYVTNNAASASNGANQFMNNKQNGIDNNSNWLNVSASYNAGTLSSSCRYWLVAYVSQGVEKNPLFHYQSYTQSPNYTAYTGYTTSGIYTTGTIDLGVVPTGNIGFASNFTATNNTTLTFQSQTSSNGSTWSGWTPATSGSNLSSPSARYVQIQGSFTAPTLTDAYSVSYATNTPVLNSITLSTVAYVSSWTSPIYDFGKMPYLWGNLVSDYSLLYDSASSSVGSVTFNTRSSTSTYIGNFSNWTSVSTGTVYGNTTLQIPSPLNRYLQVQAVLNTSADYLQTAVIYDLSVNAGIASSYTSEILNAGTQWNSWGTFAPYTNVSNALSSTLPTDTINFYAITSTSVYNISTNMPIPVTNSIPSPVGPYIEIISTFTTLSSTVDPLMNRMDIFWYGLGHDAVPCATVFNRKLFIEVESPSATTGNDTILVCQKDGTWTKDALSGEGFCIYRNKLYFGSSLNTGLVYQSEVPGLYTDDGNNYSWFYTFKPIWVSPFNQVNFNNIWIQADNTNTTLDLGYRLDESLGMFAAFSYETNSRLVRKLAITPPVSCNEIQIKVGDFNGAYSGAANINRLYLTYDNMQGQQ